jgi:hypothetical protein
MKAGGRQAYDSNQSGRAVSVGALSDMQHQTTAMELVGLQKWHGYILRFYIPICVAIILMSCMWADIIGKKADYNNPNGSWQACLVNADFTYVPLNATIGKVLDAVTETKSNLQSCILDEFNAGICSYQCVFDIATVCATPQQPVVVNNIVLPTGHFLDGFSYLGVQCIIFSAIAHAILHRSLRHPSWLISCCAMMAWFLVAIFTYYTVSPILPVPTGINSTLLTYLYYSSSYNKFKDFNHNMNHCSYALNVVWTYQAFILAVCVTVFLGLCIAIYAETIRYKSPNKPHYSHLKYTEAPVFLSGLAAVCYVIFVASKISSAVTELNAIDNFDTNIHDVKGLWYPRIWFPFAVPTLDITTIVGISCVMSVLRGFTIQSLSAFRMAFLCSAVFAISIYPGLVGAYQFYDYNDFYKDHVCRDYFLGGITHDLL